MKINWFTVIAQVINFLILVWLLRRFLYKPILDAIAAREQKIAAQIKDADAKKAEATKEQDEFKQKNEKFDQEKKELTDKAIAETKVERQKLMDEAKNEAVTLRAKQDKELEEVKINMNLEIAQKTQKEVFAISRKTLKDLASVGLEEQSVHLFINRLKALNDGEKKPFINAFKSGSNPILVRSAYILPLEQQDEIKKTVANTLQTEIQLQFEVTPELISGIEISSNGYKFAWSISEYLNTLQKSIFEKSETALGQTDNH